MPADPPGVPGAASSPRIVLPGEDDGSGTLRPPPSWGNDKLTAFHTQALRNSFASYVQMRPSVNLLIDIDALFYKAAENLRDPPEFLAAMLLLRSHSAYRAATRLAMSGEAAETFPLLRACLEYALYAVHIFRNPGYGEIWLQRHVDEEAHKRARRTFQHVAAMETLKTADERLAGQIGMLYERSIDFGAHPNERAMTGSMTVEEVAGGRVFQAIYLHGDRLTLAHLHKTTAQVGLGALLMLSIVFRQRFQLLTIDVGLEALQRVL
jgi:hypothetical protein